MHAQAPRHAVQVLWREHRPDEEMRPERRASHHDGHQARRREHRQQTDVLFPRIPLPFPFPLPFLFFSIFWYHCPAISIFLRYRRLFSPPTIIIKQQATAYAQPPNTSSPIAHQDQDPDGDDAEVADAVVGAGQVDARHGVVAAHGEEAGELQEQRRGGDLKGVEPQRAQDGMEPLEEQE